LRQAHDIVRVAEGDGPEAPTQRKPMLVKQLCRRKRGDASRVLK
jgi:hypothetical protein